MVAFTEASAIPDPTYPGLASAASGSALEAVTGALEIKVDQGQRSEGRPEILGLSVKESALDTVPVQVALTTCQDSTGWVVVDAGSGEPVSGEEYGRRHIEALVEQLDGHWYVTELAIQGFGSCLRS